MNTLIWEMQATVQMVEDALLPFLQAKNPDIKKINFLYGRPKEVNKMIQEASEGAKSRFENFPLVAMFEPYDIVGSGKYTQVQNLSILIAMRSFQEWTSYDRQMKNMEPYLYPIKDELIKQMIARPAFAIYDPEKDLTYTSTDQKGGVFFNDLVDAIELRNMTFRINNSKTCNN